MRCNTIAPRTKKSHYFSLPYFSYILISKFFVKHEYQIKYILPLFSNTALEQLGRKFPWAESIQSIKFKKL